MGTNRENEGNNWALRSDTLRSFMEKARKRALIYQNSRSGRLTLNGRT